MTQKEHIEMRELEINAEGKFYKNSGGFKWDYYGDVITCMTAAEEKGILNFATFGIRQAQ